MLKYYVIFLLFMSGMTLLNYGLDKSAAKRQTWRTPEWRLLLFGFAGGAFGAFAGMKLFHHKTRKPRFWLVNLLGAAWQIALLVYLLLHRTV